MLHHNLMLRVLQDTLLYVYILLTLVYSLATWPNTHL